MEQPVNTILNTEYIQIDFENEILITTWKVSNISLSIAKEAVNKRLSIASGNKYPLLVKLKLVKSSTKEARDFLASEGGCEGLVAGAICVNSLLENMIATFFIYLNKPCIPTKVFHDENEAKKWLSQYVIQNN